MKILVCIKQIADPGAELRLNADSSWIVEDNKMAYRMNSYDEFALEEALMIKDVMKDAEIDVISAGPERAVSSLKKSLEKGADRAILLKCGNPSMSAVETASLISDYASDKNYDIIFCGVISEDLMQGQVGPMIAGFLSIPSAVSVIKSELNRSRTAMFVRSELEGGVVENIEISLPCLVSVQTGVNLPRYPSLSNVLRARSMNVEVIDSYSGIDNADAVSVEYPPAATKGIVIEGSIEEKAGKLLDIFHEKALI